jgi:hypothetical protein
MSVINQMDLMEGVVQMPSAPTPLVDTNVIALQDTQPLAQTSALVSYFHINELNYSSL